MDLPMSSILPAQLIIEGSWQNNKPGIAACCDKVLLSRLPYFLPVVFDLGICSEWPLIAVFFFTFAGYTEIEWLYNWGQSTFRPTAVPL